MKKVAVGKILMKSSGYGLVHIPPGFWRWIPQKIHSHPRRWPLLLKPKDQFRSKQKDQGHQPSSCKTGRIGSPGSVIQSRRRQACGWCFQQLCKQWTYHLQPHFWWRGCNSREDTKKVHFHALTRVKGDPTSCRWVMVVLASSFRTTLQKQQCTSVLVLNAAPPFQRGQQRRGWSWWHCSRWMEKNRKWLIPTALKQLWRKTVPKQTRSLDANKCWQRQKAWSCHVSILSLIRWSRTRKNYLVYKSQPEQATTGTQPYWYSLEKTRQTSQQVSFTLSPLGKFAEVFRGRNETITSLSWLFIFFSPSSFLNHQVILLPSLPH